MQSKKLQNEYVVLDPIGRSEVWRSEDFWKMTFDPKHPRNSSDLGYVVSQLSFSKDWDSWEKHPNGDEFVFCVSGRFCCILDIQNELNEIVLEPGSFVVVPRHTWHTAKTTEPSSALLVTWGHGTQHRKIESS